MWQYKGCYLALALLLLAACCHAHAAHSQQQQHLISAPVFAWSSSKGCFSGGDEQQAHIQNLQVHNSPHGMMQQLLAASQEAAARKPQVLLAVLGTELKTSHLKNRVMQTVLQPLKALLESSPSSLTAPYVLHQADARDSHASKLQQLAADMQVATTVVGCSQGDADLSLDQALQQHTEGSHLVVLCTQQSAQSGSPEAVAAELQQLQEAHDKVAKLLGGDRHQLTIYAAVPDAAMSAPAGRQLLGAQADATTCGQLCQTQVKWLEGILAALILATAAFSGMCCLYMLDTPTRFEKPKEGARND